MNLPDNTDTRPPDILREGRERQRDAVVPPSLATAPPPMPSLFGSEADAAFETAKQAAREVIKNVTVGGYSPTFNGSNIDFNVPVQPPAHVTFAEIHQPVPLTPEPPKPPIPEPPKPAGTAEGASAPPPPAAPEPPQVSSAMMTAKFQEITGVEVSSRASRLSGFNPFSMQRQRGESGARFRERTAAVREAEKAGHPVGALASGDASYFYKGFIPVAFTRADGQQKIICNVDVSAGDIYEGPQANPRYKLPATDSYYLAGGGGATFPFQLVPLSEGNPVVHKVRVVAGKVNEEIPSGMSIPENENTWYRLTPGDGHTIYLIVTFAASTLVQNSVSLASAATVPNDDTESSSTTLKLHIPIGVVSKDSGKPYEIDEQFFVGNVDFRPYFTVINGALHAEFFRVVGRGPIEVPEE
jgi:hypothetical protein